MTEPTDAPAEEQRSGKRLRFRAQDFAWLLFVGVLIGTAPDTSYQALIILPLIGAFQIFESRFEVFESRRGQIVSIGLKLIFSYLLIGWTHAIDSYYSMIFLIPVVSAATNFDLLGVSVVTGIASLAYLSFLLFIPYDMLPPEQVRQVSLRAAFYAIVAFLVYEQARAKRDQMKRTQEAAEQLAEANQHLREAQASLRRSERLAALGQLTAGLAHELRNPLGTIKASAEMLTKPTAKKRPEVMDEMAEYIRSEVDRMNGLVSSFLDFAHPLQIHAADHDLYAVIGDVIKEQAELARTHEVSIELEGQKEPLVFRFDRDLLRLALTNLVQNAIQASPPGRAVKLRAQAVRENVDIFVSDQGEGIDRQNLESIFNPFFTTKPKGVGLGLALVAKIVDEHGGRIQVWSEPGKGTHFAMMLPRRGC